MSGPYRAFGFELARRPHLKPRDWFYCRYDDYGAGDPPRLMSCYEWLVHNETSTKLVDCGLSTKSALAR